MPKALVVLLALFIGGACPALAGSAAARRVIGFSADGAVFAMEEYGVADLGMGSGALSDVISLIDATNGEKLDESVEASLSAGGAALLPSLRALTAQAASGALAHHKIGLAGRRIGVDPASRAGDIFHSFDVWKVEEAGKAALDVEAPELGGKARIVVEYEAPPGRNGERGSSETPPTFTLALIKPDGKRIALTRSLSDPQAGERRTFYKYAVAEVWLLPRKSRPPVLAVIVEIFSEGGEGTSRNFIPVAIAAPGL